MTARHAKLYALQLASIGEIPLKRWIAKQRHSLHEVPVRELSSPEFEPYVVAFVRKWRWFFPVFSNKCCLQKHAVNLAHRLVSEQGQHLVPLQCNRFECLPPTKPKGSGQVKSAKIENTKQTAPCAAITKAAGGCSPAGQSQTVEGLRKNVEPALGLSAWTRGRLEWTHLEQTSLSPALR